ncbi:unnamed protein product [Rotaria sordida]|uniref:Ubiquitin conjugation factor E4 core domain-containing protein n=1 Tax=Rotaria sordida TaxID=392033 RepID=A0A818VFI5_9BILA|nr:unnamed protein product [Rotaria sordida]CAF0788565.1 unnamed protein product [Rotaria sordida]CAF3496185.1 unnamed protein product [Rotaria sordida]CAF3706221.1 unnamed protein product [Rotaria sordida]
MNELSNESNSNVESTTPPPPPPPTTTLSPDELRRRRLEKFSTGSTTKTQTTTSSNDINDKQVSTQLSNELATCQIDSQQTNVIDDTNMDIGELSTTDMIAASGEQRLLKSQHSTGDKRSYDINSNNTPKEIIQDNQLYDDGNRNGTIKKRKSDNLLNKEQEEPILRRIIRIIMNITDQNQLFINDLLEMSLKRRSKSILSDIFLRCLTSTQTDLIKSLIGNDSNYSDQYDIYLWYFLNVYTRCDYQSSSQEERDLIEHCRLLSVRYTLIYITNNGIFLDSWNKTLKLLDILLIDTCPESLRTTFLHDIVKISYNQKPKMKTCEILVRTMLYRLRQTCSQANIYINLLLLLLNLCESRNGNDRPVCTYLVTLNDWLPQVALHDGKSLQRMALLSPIFYISCFAEDDIDLLVTQLEKINEQEQDDDNSQDFFEYKEKQIRSTVQSQLYTARKLMHKIVLAFFSNISSRNAMLDYLQKFIQLNIKRTHLTVDESQVSGDGFMLNLTFVLQQLALPIDIERVDLNYPYYADDRLSIPKDQSRLYSTQDDFKTYQENIQKPHDIRFPTECVYLTLHISHLGLVATAKKPQRRNNIIRELNSAIKNLEQTQGTWRQTSMATRHEAQLERLKAELKVRK